MWNKHRLWICAALVVVLALIPASLVGGSKQMTQISWNADTARQVASAPNGAAIEAGLSAMGWETLSTLKPLAAQGDECDDPDHGKRLKCKSELLMAEVCNTAALAAQDDAGLFAQSTQDELSKLCTYGTASVAAADPEEFKSVGLRRHARGIVMAYTGPDRDDSSQDPCEDPSDASYEDCYLGPGYKSDDDGDGICNPKGKGDAAAQEDEPAAAPKDHGKKPNQLYSEWCAEALGDGIGDEDGFCEIQGKGNTKFLEPCLEVSGIDALEEQEENYDVEKLQALEDTLDAHTGTLRANNAALATVMQELRVQQEISRELLAGGAEQCLNLLDEGLGPPNPLGRIPYPAIAVAMGLAVAAEGFYDSIDASSEQTVLGANASTASIVGAVAKAALNLTWQELELADDAVSGVRLDNAVKCLQYLGGQLDDIANGVNEANAMIEHVVEHRRVHLQVVELKEKREFLVSATEAGRPGQPGHEMVETFTVRVSEKQPLSFVDVTASTTWTPQGDGLYLVVVDLPQALKNAELFVFEVGHTVSYEVEVIKEVNGTKQTVMEPRYVEHSGFTLFDRSAQSNVGGGQ
jgi:hypothetical protein